MSPGFAPVVDPAKDRLLLVVGQTAIVAEHAVRTFGVPRRHHAARHRVVHLVELRLRAVVLEQRERTHAARTVAGRAVLVENRRDVFGERGIGEARCRCRRSRERDADQRDAGDRDRLHEADATGAIASLAIQVLVVSVGTFLW